MTTIPVAVRTSGGGGRDLRSSRRISVEGPWSVISFAGGLALLEVLSRIVDVVWFPTVTGVVGRLYRLTLDGQILGDLARSTQNLATGFLISAVVGVLVGIAMGRYSVVERMLDPYVTGLMTAPTIVFAPVYFSIFGLNRWAIIFLIVQYSVFVVIINTVTAVQSIDAELVEMASVFGASERQRLRKVILPAALPLTMAGLRLGMGRAVKGMINGELLIAVIGLGATSQNFARAFDAEGVFAVLLVVIALALVAVKLVDLVDKKLNGWLPDTQR
jgi:NitT/TauT family transport system permease protein